MSRVTAMAAGASKMVSLVTAPTANNAAASTYLAGAAAARR